MLSKYEGSSNTTLISFVSSSSITPDAMALLYLGLGNWISSDHRQSVGAEHSMGAYRGSPNIGCPIDWRCFLLKSYYIE